MQHSRSRQQRMLGNIFDSINGYRHARPSTNVVKARSSLSSISNAFNSSPCAVLSKGHKRRIAEEIRCMESPSREGAFGREALRT